MCIDTAHIDKQNTCSYLHSIFYSLPYLCYTIDVRDGGMIAVVTVCCLTESFTGKANYTWSPPVISSRPDASGKCEVSMRVQHIRTFPLRWSSHSGLQEHSRHRFVYGTWQRMGCPPRTIQVHFISHTSHVLNRFQNFPRLDHKQI